MMSGGSFAGPVSVVHDLISKPGSVSAIAGTSGTTGVRSFDVTPSARTFFARYCTRAPGILSKIMWTWPARRSCIAGAAPRYGTCTISTPAIILKSSPDRCSVVPLPAEAYEYLFGFFFSSAISSGRLWAGRSRLTASILGSDQMVDTKVKSVRALNGSLA